MSEIFTCAICHNSFETTWSDEEAWAEAEGVFSPEELEAVDVVCDDCYKVVIPALPGVREEVEQEAAAAGLSVGEYLVQEAGKEREEEGKGMIIPVRVPADLRVVLAGERRFYLNSDHPLYQSVCPVCDNSLGYGTSEPCVAVFVGIDRDSRERAREARKSPRGRFATGSAVLVHCSCAGVPADSPSGPTVIGGGPSGGPVVLENDAEVDPDPIDADKYRRMLSRVEVQEITSPEEAARKTRDLLDIEGLNVSINVSDIGENTAFFDRFKAAAFFDQFAELPHDSHMDSHGQWCWRHWAPCPVLGGNGIGASTEIIDIWLRELAPKGIRSPEQLNSEMDKTGKICCALGDERMYALWGHWPPTSPIAGGLHGSLAEPIPPTGPNPTLRAETGDEEAEQCCEAYPDCAEPHVRPLAAGGSDTEE